MKRFVFLASLAAFSLALFSCAGGVKSTAGGLADEAYLDFVGTPRYYVGGVMVTVDNKFRFKAIVNDAAENTPKGNTYAVSSGSHLVSVSYEGKELFSHTFFLSAQETRRVPLP
jgi:hypothetical protein